LYHSAVRDIITCYMLILILHSRRILTRISQHEPTVSDLAWRLLNELQKTPLGLSDMELLEGTASRSTFTPPEHSDTPRIAIIAIAEELAYSKCPSQHSWLGICLLRIVELTIQLRPLMDSEYRAINALVQRRFT